MRGLACALTVAATAIACDAGASGLYFSERGVRPLGRGGAFTAGADDLGAFWYNPAGLYEAGSQVLVDLSWLNFDTEYTRRALLEQIDPNTGEVVSRHEQTFPIVEGESSPIPIPTLGWSYRVAERWVIGLGVLAPYAAITSFPETLDGQPAPSRYSLITLGGWVAVKLHDMVHLGVGFDMLVGRFVATTMFGACVPQRFFCAPEQPEWDSLVQLSASPIVAPSGNIGIKVLPHEAVRIGATFHAPYAIRAPAEIRVRLPATPAFETARQEGSDGDVSFELPWALRLGVEVRPVPELRLELDGSMEGWSMHDEIAVVPDGVALRDVAGFPDPYLVPSASIPRNFEDSYGVRLGGEYEAALGDGYALTPRLGLSYETSAIPPEYMSVLTVDIDKLTLGLGVSLTVDAFRFDAVYAHVFGEDVEVAPEDARSPLLQPVEAAGPKHYVNGGDYSARANVVGFEARWNYE
jgi:long-chain fatty acid transport protein